MKLNIKEFEMLIDEAINEYNELNKQVELPPNVLLFDQSKRRRPLMSRVNKEPAKVISLDIYRAFKKIVYKKGA